jgi:5-methylthioribose kinase
MMGRKRKPKKRTPGTPGPPLDLGRVVFTKHALKRFEERAPEDIEICAGQPEKTAMEILARAREGTIGKVERVKRLINNKLVPARYFFADEMMFVIIDKESGHDVVTIEFREGSYELYE